MPYHFKQDFDIFRIPNPDHGTFAIQNHNLVVSILKLRELVQLVVRILKLISKHTEN